jgi:hypothetical protein
VARRERAPGRRTAGLRRAHPARERWFHDGGIRKLKTWAKASERLNGVPVPIAPPIRHSPVFAQAFSIGDWSGGYAPRSKAHRDILRLMRAVTGRIDARVAEKPRPESTSLSTVTAAGLTA